MEITYQKHSNRKRQAIDLWLKMATDFNAGIPAKAIAKRYTNPYTRKPYTRGYVYIILRKLAKKS